ncbi:MAG: hypothetical protein ACTHJR_00740 [Sphingomonas sp.]|uniref:hypothetical protein n=1 Tax=Sphingomonas sp. TaxID=28214 RepID=UPI003F80F497
MRGRTYLCAVAVGFAASAAALAQNSATSGADGAPRPQATVQTTGSNAPATSPSILPAGTPLIVAMDDGLSTESANLGDRFHVTVASDVVDRGTVVIPKGTTGYGEVTFVGRKGAFGRPGILAITLRALDLDGKQVALDGRYREEGKSHDGAATMLATGVLSAFITGKTTGIPKGRALKAHTGDDISYVPAVTSRGAPEPASTTSASAPASVTTPARGTAGPPPAGNDEPAPTKTS